MYFRNKCSMQSARCLGTTGMVTLPSQAGKQPRAVGASPHLSITEREGAGISLQNNIYDQKACVVFFSGDCESAEGLL